MKAEFYFTIDDYNAFQFHEVRKLIENKRVLIIILNSVILIGVVALSLLFLMDYVLSFSDGPMSLLPPLICFVGLPVIIFAVYSLMRYTVLYKHTLNKMLTNLSKGKNMNSMLGPMEIEITPEHIMRKTRYLSSEFSWKGVLKIDQTDDHIFIYDTDLSAYIIPKKAFKDHGEGRDFFLKAHEYLRDSRK